jgi:hypothetical protein
MFERFWRKDLARSSSEHSGIGLSVARAFAHTLHLSLDAELGPGGLLRMRLGPFTLLLENATEAPRGSTREPPLAVNSSP